MWSPCPPVIHHMVVFPTAWLRHVITLSTSHSPYGCVPHTLTQTCDHPVHQSFTIWLCSPHPDSDMWSHCPPVIHHMVVFPTPWHQTCDHTVHQSFTIWLCSPHPDSDMWSHCPPVIHHMVVFPTPWFRHVITLSTSHSPYGCVPHTLTQTCDHTVHQSFTIWLCSPHPDSDMWPHCPPVIHHMVVFPTPWLRHVTTLSTSHSPYGCVPHTLTQTCDHPVHQSFTIWLCSPHPDSDMWSPCPPVIHHMVVFPTPWLRHVITLSTSHSPYGCVPHTLTQTCDHTVHQSFTIWLCSPHPDLDMWSPCPPVIHHKVVFPTPWFRHVITLWNKHGAALWVPCVKYLCDILISSSCFCDWQPEPTMV